MTMRTEVINPSNWKVRQVEVKVNEDGTVFEIYGYRFRIEQTAWIEGPERNVKTDDVSAADLIEYKVFSDDGQWDDDEPMAKGAYWPSLYQNERVVMYKDYNTVEREGDTAWEAAAKVLANTI